MSIKHAQALGAALGVVADNMEEITGTIEGTMEFFRERGIGSLETQEEFDTNLGNIPR